MADAKDLIKQIADLLRKAKIPFQTDIDVGGVRGDFLIKAPDGRRIVVEAKSWNFPGFTTRAGRQADLYEQELGADKAFFVLADLERNQPDKGVLTPQGLIEVLQQEFEKSGPARGGEPAKPGKPRARRKRKTIFAAMPFAGRYDDTYLLGMAYAARKVRASCIRVDRAEFQGNIVEEVKRQIRESSAVIVDLSESKPNVLYECGFAHALNRPCVHICSTEYDKLPFDVAQLKVIKYEVGRINQLRGKLVKSLRAILG